MSGMDELARAILKDLLADFTARKLTVNDLDNNYEGVSVATLQQQHCGGDVSTVDFDLALQGLESSRLIGTGPMEVSDIPNVIAIFSKREYAYLTAAGYREAKKLPRQKSPPAQNVHISGGTFHQSPIGIGTHVSQSLSGTLGNSSVFNDLRQVLNNVPDEGKRAKLIASVEEMEKAQQTPSFGQKYKEFISLAADHLALITPFLPALTLLL